MKQTSLDTFTHKRKAEEHNQLPFDLSSSSISKLKKRKQNENSSSSPINKKITIDLSQSKLQTDASFLQPLCYLDDSSSLFFDIYLLSLESKSSLDDINRVSIGRKTEDSGKLVLNAFFTYSSQTEECEEACLSSERNEVSGDEEIDEDDDLMNSSESDDSDDNKSQSDKESNSNQVKNKRKSSKRGKYKKGSKLTGDDAFIKKYVESDKSPFGTWLRYNKDHHTLFCIICIEAGNVVRNKWGNREKGCSILRKKSCLQHQTGKKHKQAIAIINEFKLTDCFKQPFPIEPLNKATINSSFFPPPIPYKNLFENIYWICKEELPLQTIISLNSYTKTKLQVEIPEYHLSSKSISKIILAISQVMTHDLLKEIKDSEYIGILVDESKDVSDKEILLLYIRYLDKKTFQSKEVFLNLFELEKTDASTIYSALKKYLIDQNLWNKIKFLCTDGAKVMLSDKNGVAGKFKKDIPDLSSFHCLCHQEALALKHTYQHFPEFQNFNKTLFSVISYFDNSPKKLVILQTTQNNLEYENIYKLITAKEVRWNSFFYATNRIRELYPAILETLQTISKGSFKIHEKANAEDLLNRISDFDFLFMLHWLSDFLAPICFLNKILQSSTYKLAELASDVQDSLNFLNESYINVKKVPLNDMDSFSTERTLDQVIKHHLQFKGFHLSNFLNNVKILNEKEAQFSFNDSTKNYVYQIKFTKLKAISLKFIVLEAAKFLSTELNGMIPDKGNFYKNFEIFNFVNLLKIARDKLGEYGNSEVWSLAQKYLVNKSEFLLEKDLIILEWYNMKIHLVESLTAENHLTYILTEPLFQNGYEGIMELIKIYLVLPCSNAEVERGFSAMKRIKTELRNKLGIGTMLDLMMISLNGVEAIKWDPSLSFQKWICSNNIRNLS